VHITKSNTICSHRQIWHALENDLYLEASRLFLLAKMVYKNLQMEEDVPFVVIVSLILEKVLVERAFVVT